jgi:hypothetical protein
MLAPWGDEPIRKTPPYFGVSAVLAAVEPVLAGALVPGPAWVVEVRNGRAKLDSLMSDTA